MGFVARLSVTSSPQWYGLVTVRRKWLKIFCKGGCCSQVSRAVVLRPKRRVQRVVSGERDCDARYNGQVNRLPSKRREKLICKRVDWLEGGLGSSPPLELL